MAPFAFLTSFLAVFRVLALLSDKIVGVNLSNRDIVIFHSHFFNCVFFYFPLARRLISLLFIALSATTPPSALWPGSGTTRLRCLPIKPRIWTRDTAMRVRLRFVLETDFHYEDLTEEDYNLFETPEAESKTILFTYTPSAADFIPVLGRLRGEPGAVDLVLFFS